MSLFVSVPSTQPQRNNFASSVGAMRCTVASRMLARVYRSRSYWGRSFLFFISGNSQKLDLLVETANPFTREIRLVEKGGNEG